MTELKVRRVKQLTSVHTIPFWTSISFVTLGKHFYFCEINIILALPHSQGNCEDWMKHSAKVLGNYTVLLNISNNLLRIIYWLKAKICSCPDCYTYHSGSTATHHRATHQEFLLQSWFYLHSTESPWDAEHLRFPQHCPASYLLH